MKQEDTELLLKDLCGRLPYGVKTYGNYSYHDGEKIVDDIQTKIFDIYDIDWLIHNIEIKPYLFPLSSMTEEQKEEFDKVIGITLEDLESDKQFSCLGVVAEIDFYHKYHFDYRGLIEKGLAIDATNLNIY